MSRWLGLAAFAALGAFVVMTCWITARPLWLDEAFERRITTLPVDVWFDLLYTREANMVFHHAFLRAWTGAQESAVVWVRLPSALATAGACFVFVGLARRLLRDPRLAVVATFLFATNAFVLGHGIQARGYAFVLLFAVVSTRLVLASVDRAVERRPDAGTSLGYAVSAILLTTAHVLASSLLAVHAVAWLVRWRSRTRAGRRRILARTGTAWLVACLASALVAGFVFGQGREGQVDWIERPGFFGIYHALRGLAGNETYTTLFTLLLVSMCCLRCWRHPTLERSIIAGGLLLPILTPLALTFLLRPLWVERYLIPASPFLALALADGIGTILNRRRERAKDARRRAAFDLAMVTLPLCLVVFVRGPHTVHVDWQRAAEVIRTRHRTDDALLTFPWYLRTALDPYLDEESRRDLVCLWPPTTFAEYAPYPRVDENRAQQLLQRPLPESGFLVTSWHPFDTRLVDALLTRLKTDEFLIETLTLHRVTIHRWRRVPPSATPPVVPAERRPTAATD